LSVQPAKPAVNTAGDPIPPACEVIEVRVAELKQLFKAIDPSPFRERDLDSDAEDFIVSWAKDAASDAPLGLVVYVDRPAGLPEEPAILRDAIQEFFGHRAARTRQRLHELFHNGRTSLVIGLACLAVGVLLGDIIGRALEGRSIGEILRESLLIGGWVAMWRPMEVFLYDWWPIRADARLYDRLARMPVRIAYTHEAGSEAWRWDWPAVSASAPRRAVTATAEPADGARQ
jgi:hypothetical protein